MRSMFVLAQSFGLWRMIVSCVTLCLSAVTLGAVGVRITSLCQDTDYLFVRGEVYGQITNQECIIDVLVATNLMAEWRWIDANRLEAGDDATALLIVPQVLGMETMPRQLFVKMSDRVSENGDMQDRDSDGSPNVYEIHNDTNPYIADFESSPKISVLVDCEYATFTNALWSSSPYSIIEIKGHDNVVVVKSSWIDQLYDADGDGLPDVWEIDHGLSQENADDALEDFDGDGLVNLHEYWASSDPNTFDATNTLLSVCAMSVDNRLAGKDATKALHKFSNYMANGTNFVLNADFWAHDVDTSCASMWNDATTDYWGGSCFQSLDSDLPDAVVPVKILPSDYASYIRNAKRLPVVTFDQEEKLIVADSAALRDCSNRSEASAALRPYDVTRLSFFETVVNGDSGNPRFFVMGSQLILLSVMHYGGVGSGCFVSHYKTEIQRAMDELSPGYQIEEVNLDGYDKIDE